MHESTRLLQELVSRPSVNPMGRDLPEDQILEHRVTDFLEGFFRELGARFSRHPVAPKRENIVAYHDSTPSAKTLLFEAHQDTVPTDNMTIAPFEPKIENGRLYGRGSCDIKGGMASMLAAFARVVRDKPSQAANVVMACTVDEEHTFTGVTDLVRRGAKADMAIVAEPTQLNIVKAHKGVMRWHVLVRGRACHSSAPQQGVNAIYRMCDLLQTIEQYAKRLQET